MQFQELLSPFLNRSETQLSHNWRCRFFLLLLKIIYLRTNIKNPLMDANRVKHHGGKIAGLDSGRYQWSIHFPVSVSCLGFVIVVLGQVIFHIAKSQNTFFSSVVRIQTERGHTVCETGLYKVIRHP